MVYKTRYSEEIEIVLPEQEVPFHSPAFSHEKKFLIDNSRLKDLGFKTAFTIEDEITDLFNFLEISNAK